MDQDEIQPEPDQFIQQPEQFHPPRENLVTIIDRSALFLLAIDFNEFNHSRHRSN